jgi:hypothetical protein
MSDGTPIPGGSTIQYQVYIRTDPTGNSVASWSPITALQCLVIFAAEGFYDIGIKAQRVVGGQVVSESTVAWSNDPLVARGETISGSNIISPLPGFRICVDFGEKIPMVQGVDG